jgi:hypothetical protein
VLLHPPVEPCGGVVLTAAHQHLRLCDPAHHERVALPEVFGAIHVIGGIVPGRFFEQCEARFRLPLVEQPPRILQQRVSEYRQLRAAGRESQRERREKQSAESDVHRVSSLGAGGR